MKENHAMKYSVQVSFEEIRLTPLDDILVLGKKCPQGKIGVSKAYEFLEFDPFEFGSVNVEAIFINKQVLKKMDQNKIVSILTERVFPFISDREILHVDFKLKIFYDSMEGEY